MSTKNVSPRFRTWPITAARSIEPELKKMGLRMPAKYIDGTTTAKSEGGDASNAEEVHSRCYLSDALVSVGPAGRGGTGSFVSKDGLILTNWHVAYDAVRQASLAASSESGTNVDYVKDGFVSRSREEEIRGPNYEVWITKSCVDVSDQVVSVISEETDPLKRANRVRDVMQEIAKMAQEEETEGASGTANAASGKRCDVQEMLPNESYVLFTYERLRDVRIVYVPPISLGNFGGDTDNFEWPRHTADFTLLRAYVGPNGDAAEYSPENVPYQSSESRIVVQKNGASEGGMVFLLGFPGSTMRYAPTSRLQYSDDVAVPNMIKDFTRKLDLIAKFEKDSAEAALKLGNSKKGLANELKRSKGKLVMMRKLGLLQERKAEEDALCNKTDDDEAKVALNRLSEIYDVFRKNDATTSALEACRGIYAGSALLATGHALHEYIKIEKVKPDNEREAAYRKRNLPFLFKRLAKRIGDIHVPHEVELIGDAIEQLSYTDSLSSDLKDSHSQIVNFLTIDGTLSGSKLKDFNNDSFQSLFEEDKDNTCERLLDDPFVRCAAVLWNAYETERDRSKALLSERDALFAKLLDLQRKYSNDDEVIYPDCNGSLRVSAGNVEGYNAADAIVHKPSTTLAGLFDKVTEAQLTNSDDDEEFVCPEKLYKLLSSNTEDAKNVPVCLLYSTDTVGGNSGSPVMNADGELVAINFDRQRQGLMNEFKWSKDYSRSIGVDIRYILWLIGKYDGASHLVDEMLEL